MTSYSAMLREPKVYHEKESIGSNVKFLFNDEEANKFWVKCSKAILNCLLQREHYKDHVRVRIEERDMVATYSRLKLNRHFRIKEINIWQDSKVYLFGSIMAMTQALSFLNITLTPVDDITYTSLIEKPTAYICLIQDGWVVLRKVSRKWYLLDPRTSARAVSDTYLHLIIMQLIQDKDLVFQIHGGEFSRMTDRGLRTNHLQSPSSIATEDGERQQDTRPTSVESSESACNDQTGPETSDGRNSRRRNLEPKPPDIPDDSRDGSDMTLNGHFDDRQSSPTLHQIRRDEVIKMLTHLSKLQLGPIFSRSRKPAVRRPDSVATERSRSEVRQGSFQRRTREEATTSRNETNFQDSYNDNWPSLEAATATRQKKRARSTSRPRRPSQGYSLPPPEAWKGQNASWSKGEERVEAKSSGTVHSNKDSSCCICLENKPDHALYPCGHQCLCGQCRSDFLKSFTVCPICKSPVTDVIRIYNT